MAPKCPLCLCRRGLSIAVAVVLCVLSSKAQINADQVVNIGRNALYFEDYMVAIQYFNQAIKAKPYLAKPYFYRAIAKLNLEDFRGAEEDASKSLELNPYITDAYEVRGVARQNQGNDAGAIEDYKYALELLPRNRQLLFNVALAQTAVKDYAAADSTFSKLLTYYPGFDNGYIGRAKLRFETGDTIRAFVDLDTALVINPNSFNARVTRAEVRMQMKNPDFKEAVEDVDRAIRLEPKIAGLYVNRAFMRYNLNDWYGAMDDYDYAISLEPTNRTALFNRGLLNAEADAADKALEDFSAVIALDPGNYRAHFNRAVVRAKKHDFKGAVEDANVVINALPEYPIGYLLRCDLERQRGNLKRAAADYDHAMALSKKIRARKSTSQGSDVDTAGDDPEVDVESLTKQEFASLLTVDDNSDMRQEYNNTSIRGRIQDKNINIEPEPMVELSYYSSPTELTPDTYYIKEIDDLNATRQLRFVVFVTVAPPVLYDSELIDRHFNSIDYYNSYLATHTPRSIDFIGRALDFITVKNYASAINDLDRAISLTPDFAPAYMLRAQARYRLFDASGNISDVPEGVDGGKIDAVTREGLDRKTLDDIISDYDRVIELTPGNPFAYYNKAVALISRSDYAEAEKALDKALELKADFGQAYYNRGFVRLRNGRRADGINDLSRAGELGVVSAYNLIKRISR